MRSEPWEILTKNLLEKVLDGTRQKAIVISGMGGCGKTQPVAQFIKEYGKR
jgi:hypothetical protein